MKVLLTICLLLSATLSVVSSQTKGRRTTSVEGTSLTRLETREAERRLSEMHYWTGIVDGVFDPASRAALIAFQKWEGRAVTGKLTIEELEAIRRSALPENREALPKAREVGYAHVEVDLDRQLMLIVEDEQAGVVQNERQSKETLESEWATESEVTRGGVALRFQPHSK